MEPDDSSTTRSVPESTFGMLLKHRAVAIGSSLAGAAVTLSLLSALSQHAVAANSDSATVVLEGQSIATGNLLLKGWSLSLDSFWSIDALFYGLGVRVLGLRADLVNVVPAFIALLVIVIGIAIAREGQRGTSAVIAGGTVVALLVLPSHALAFFFLQGPWHVGTALWCLVAFVGLRSGRLDWGWVIAVVFLAAGLLGDFQMLALGVVPAFLAGIVAMMRTRTWRSGLAPTTAAAASLLLAAAVREIALSIGTFTYQESHHTASMAQMEINVGHLASWSAALLGVVPGPFGGASVSLVLEIAHALGLAVVFASVLVGIVRLVRGASLGQDRTITRADLWRLDDLLVLGVLADLAVFELLALSNNVEYARYLTAGVVFAAILAGRTVGRVVTAVDRVLVIRGAAVLGLAIIASFSAEVLTELRAPVPKQPVLALDSFLSTHDLHDGIGDYWAASVVTLESRGTIRVRPVVANLQHRIVADGRQSDDAWYAGKQFACLVYQALPYGRVDAATVAATFGVPEHTYTIGEFFVAVWTHPLTLSGAEFP